MIMDGTIKVNDNVVIRSKSGKKYYAVITMNNMAQILFL